VVLWSHVVCLFVCNVGGFWSHRLEFFQNNVTISYPGLFTLCNPNITGLLLGEHPEIFARIGVGCWKKCFQHTKAVISLKRSKIGPRLLSLLLRAKRKSNAHFDCAKINDLGWHYRSLFYLRCGHNNYSRLLTYTTLCPKKTGTHIMANNFHKHQTDQCHLIELFLQHFLIIYHKNYSHSRVPPATVTMATHALVQTNVCAITACLPIVHMPPWSICARPHLISFLPTSGHLIART